MSIVYTRVRTRSKQQLMDLTETKYDYRSNPSRWVLYGTQKGTTVSSMITETMRDMIPRGSGVYPERACHHTKVVRELGLGKALSVRLSGPSYYDTPNIQGYTIVQTPAPGWTPSGSRPDLAAEILENLDPTASVVEGIPFLKEFRQTVDMIRNPFNFLSSIPVPKNRSTRLGKHLRKLGFGPTSSAWLQYSYGWKPLLGDLSAIAYTLGSAPDTYKSYLDGTPFQKYKKFRVYDTSSSTESSLYTKSYWEFSAVAGVTMYARALPARNTVNEMSYGKFLARKLGFSLDNLAPAAWEMVPYSFVADWFLPVGEKLKSLRSTPCNFETKRVSYHNTVETTREHFVWHAPISYFDKQQYPLKQAFAAQKDTFQQYWRNDPDYGPEGLSLFNQSPLSTSRSISALSLIAQRLMLPLKK